MSEITSITNVEQGLQEQLKKFADSCRERFSYRDKMPILYFILFFGFFLFQTFLFERILKHEYSIIEYVVNPGVVNPENTVLVEENVAGNLVSGLVEGAIDIGGNLAGKRQVEDSEN